MQRLIYKIKVRWTVKRINKGFTLIELAISAAATVIVVLCIGMMLVNSQKSYNHTYDRVYSEVVEDAYVNDRLFDSIVRKSSLSAKAPLISDDKQTIELYYYDSANSPAPDKFARFYLNGQELNVDYGNLDSHTLEAASVANTSVVARNVNDVQFQVTGANVQMALDLDNGRQTMTVICSAVRYSE